MAEVIEDLRATCTRFLSGDGTVPPAHQLAALGAADLVVDHYGEGGVRSSRRRSPRGCTD